MDTSGTHGPQSTKGCMEHGSPAVIVGSGNTSQVAILGCVQVFACPLCKEQRNSDAERPMDNENEISLTLVALTIYLVSS